MGSFYFKDTGKDSYIIGGIKSKKKTRTVIFSKFVFGKTLQKMEDV